MRPRLLVLLLLSTLASAQTYVPITSTFADSDARGNPYDVRSDGGGSYQDNVDGVTTFLTSNGYNHQVYGDWQFGTYSSTARMVSLTFDPSNAVQPGDPAYQFPARPPFWGTQTVLAHIEDKCTFIDVNNTVNNMLQMKAGSSFTCPVIIRFPRNATKDYRLLIAPAFGYPETSDALVSCNSADSGGCNDWFIDPVPKVEKDGGARPGKAIARLVVGNAFNNRGDFYVRFHFHLTRP